MTTFIAAHGGNSPEGAGQATVPDPGPGRLTALQASWLFDGISSALNPDPVVLIEGSTIREVSFGGSAPQDATVIDLLGATLLPGLIDTHVHLAFDASADVVGSLARRQDDQVVEAMKSAGRAALRGGVTTVRDPGDRGYLSLGLRGQDGLPTILAAGPPITTPGGHCHYLGGTAEPTVREVRAAVREHAQRGVDVIKIMASGGNLTPGSRQDLVQFPPEVLLAQLGYGRAEALRAVTSVAAGVCGLGHRKGRIAPGFDADVLAVSGDPIADPDSLHRIRAVYARGTPVASAR